MKTLKNKPAHKQLRFFLLILVLAFLLLNSYYKNTQYSFIVRMITVFFLVLFIISFTTTPFGRLFVARPLKDKKLAQKTYLSLFVKHYKKYWKTETLLILSLFLLFVTPVFFPTFFLRNITIFLTIYGLFSLSLGILMFILTYRNSPYITEQAGFKYNLQYLSPRHSQYRSYIHAFGLIAFGLVFLFFAFYVF